MHVEVKNTPDSENVGYMQVEWILEFEASMGINASTQGLFQSSVLDDDRTYVKRFLNFNRRCRIVALVALLKGLKILIKVM